MSSQGHLGQGDRLKEGPAPELLASAFALEAGDGPLLYQGMSLADLAHTVMLLEAGLIPATAGPALLAALLELHTIPPDQFPFDPAHGDAYTNRDYILRQKAPDVAGWLQTGRARREVTTIAYTLLVREGLLAFSGALLDLLTALLDLAKAHQQTLMPDYTYLQTAQPTTLAHYLLTFAQPITRDLDRLRDAFARINLSPAGIGSTNGSRLPLNRQRLAELLGFEGLVWHTRDAMWQPDTPIEVLAVVMAALTNADRLSEDLQLWTTTEFGLVELADRHSRISVIMPQKKNPYSLAFVRGVAREMVGRLTSMVTHQLTPSGQLDNRIFAYGSVPRALEQARQAVQLLAGTVAGLTVNPTAMAERAGQSFSGATDLAELIMLTCGLDPHTSHRIVGQAVRLAVETHQPLTAEILDGAAEIIIRRSLGLSAQIVAETLTPAVIVNTRTGPGGAAPAPVTEMIESYRVALAAAAQWRAETDQRLTTATTRLVARARELAGAVG